MFSGGVFYGLGAALGWGLADFMVAVIARRIGSFVTLVLAQSASVLFFTALLASGVVRLPGWHPGLLALPAIGILGALSYTAFYRALQLGPIALVSPIVAGYAAVVIALSLTVGGEAIPALEAAVDPVATAFAYVGRMYVIGRGVEFGTAREIALKLSETCRVAALRAIRRTRGRTRGGAGPLLAALAMAGFGVGAFLVGRYAKTTGWFGATYLSRLGSVTVVGFTAIVLAMRHRRGTRGDPLRRRPTLTEVAVTCAIGVLDIGGFAAFARGSELGFISITAAASVIYPMIPILFGVLYLRERPAFSQWVGVATVGAGLTLLTLGR